jgi:signal transduction histidine kinase
MGMGLPLARKLAEAMGGLLSGSSEPGLVSVFSLDLPVP